MLLKKTLSVLTALLLLVSSPEALVNIHAEGANSGDGAVTETSTGTGEGTDTGGTTGTTEGTGEGTTDGGQAGTTDGTGTGDTTGGAGDTTGGSGETGGTTTGEGSGGTEGTGDGTTTGEGAGEGTGTPTEGEGTPAENTDNTNQKTGDLSDAEKQEEKKDEQDAEEEESEEEVADDSADDESEAEVVDSDDPDHSSTVDIVVTKNWVDNTNAGNTRPESININVYEKGTSDAVRTLKLSKPEDDSTPNEWKGIIESLPKYDNDGKEIQYEVREESVNGYTSELVPDGEIPTYEYPTNTSSYEGYDVSIGKTNTVTVTGGDNYQIQPGLRTDRIAATEVVFNSSKLSVSLAEFHEYDAFGVEVIEPNDSRFTFNKKGGYVRFTGLGSGSGVYVSTDHYFTLTFPDAVTILDGTSTGSTAPVVLTISNVSVYKNNTRTWSQVIYSSLWVGPGNSSNGAGGLKMDMNFKVPGIESGQVLISFVDIDVTSNSTGKSDDPRNESVYLMDGFENTIYTLPLNSTNPTRVSCTNFEERNELLRAYARTSDGGTLQSGFVARANLSKEGFNLRWTGTGCATQLFSQIKPFALKTTVDQKTAGGIGGTISEQHDWEYRNYGEAKVIKMTPNPGYHISRISIDGNPIELTESNPFTEEGILTLTTGWTGNGRSGTEAITLYQRANGVVDVYLPKQNYAVGNTAPTRTDHWIDVSYEPNGIAESYIITNTLIADISGTKTWIAGDTPHVDNTALKLTLMQRLEGAEISTAVEYKYDAGTQLSWEGDRYTITGIPQYNDLGQKYVYTIEEGNVAGFVTTYDDTHLNITNSLPPEETEVRGSKKWNDGGRYPHDNASELKISLYQSSKTVEKHLFSITPDWNENVFVFSNLPKYDPQGYVYKYTLSEEMPDTTPSYLEPGDEYTYDENATGPTFTNTLTGTTAFSGRKIWNDGGIEHNNADEITLVLYGERSDGSNKRQVTNQTPTWDGNKFTYTDLPKYDSEGYKIRYSVRESGINNAQTGNEKKQPQNTDYTVLYDGEVWDFNSYSSNPEAYNVTAYETIENRLTPLVIRKTVPMLMLFEGNGDPAVVFNIQITNKKGAIKYNNKVGLKLSSDTGYEVNEAGERVYELRIDSIPAVQGADTVTVTEVYTAGYNNTKSEVTFISGEGVDVPYYECNITNDPGTTPPPGDGIVNHYKDGEFQYSSDGEPALPVEQ